jgi:hypothetical protein
MDLQTHWAESPDAEPAHWISPDHRSEACADGTANTNRSSASIAPDMVRMKIILLGTRSSDGSPRKSGMPSRFIDVSQRAPSQTNPKLVTDGHVALRMIGVDRLGTISTDTKSCARNANQ